MLKNRYRKIIILANLLTITAAFVVGVVGVAHSNLFNVKVVEVEDLPEGSPLDANTIIEISKVPLDEINLFSLNLLPIKKRLLDHPWIDQVRLSKKFPQTVSISVSFKQPIALLQKKNGTLFYVDQNAKAFAPLELSLSYSLPVVVGASDESLAFIIQFLSEWKQKGMSDAYPISSVETNPERGVRFVVTYALGQSVGRSMIEFGQKFDVVDEINVRIARLQEVLAYIQKNNLNAHHVFADLGKKIVVRIGQRS